MESTGSLGLVDSHAHIQSSEFETDVAEVLQRARDAGVEKIIAVGGAGPLASNWAALQLTKDYSGIYSTVGMHPHDAKEVSEEALRELKSLAADPAVVAIGETGLDFYYNHSPPEVQSDLFRRFIQMALETDLPLIVHDRDAHREVARHLRQEGERRLRGVIHCFTGDFDTAREFLDLGFYLSFTGIITFKNAGSLREVVRKVPLNRILLETDSPYLAPVPYRGRRNEPAFVVQVAEVVAQLKGSSLAEIARVTSKNVQDLFGV